MIVYGPRLYFGPIGESESVSSYSRGTMAPMIDLLTWNRQSPGWYRADLDNTDTGVLRWEIVNTEARRWEIISITSGMERRRHGAAYTLREAREVVGNFHRSNLLLAAQKGN
jgi:hypothetical protein